MRVPQVLVSRLLAQQPPAYSSAAALITSTAAATTTHRLALLGGGGSSVISRCSSSSSNTLLSQTSAALRRTYSTTSTTTLMNASSSSSSANSSSSSSTTTTVVVSADEMLETLFADRCLEGQDVGLAMTSLAQADCVCFDVDSTVIDEEGIDVLAAYLGQGEQVAALTLQAMEGGMKFQDALKARLDLLKPSKADILACLQQTPLQLTAGVADLVQALQDANKQVYLVSGGFRIMIEPVADALDISHDRIYANTIWFDDEPTGNYKSFDATEPTSADMGKPAALELIQKAGNYQTMVMIGDGATDAQAKPPAAAFVGFGGVAVRTKVQEVADWFVTDFDDLTRVVRAYGNNNSKKE